MDDKKLLRKFLTCIITLLEIYMYTTLSVVCFNLHTFLCIFCIIFSCLIPVKICKKLYNSMFVANHSYFVKAVQAKKA